MSIPGFTEHAFTRDGVELSYSRGGSGLPLLLLHGFPQTRAMWMHVAPALAETHDVICPDLRGYGNSAKPGPVSAYSFREMARDQLAVMGHLGFERFAVAGHDRGGRVAHRLALDAPEAVTRLCVMDIVPTATLLAPLRREVAQSYYHWFFLAQPAPLPETLIGHDPDLYFESCLSGWGGAGLAEFDDKQLAAYRAAWRDPETIRGMCNDYRAALMHDFDDDSADADARVHCPTWVFYGAQGAMAGAYDVPAVWSGKCTEMSAQAIRGGHFFVDTNPGDTSAALRAFLD
ncbi:haloacetate dehalogenase [Cribrihabitans marinus]|uniref:Haloacetate dehalogenase n=1 Tax=Cribrihabitans marinus TaxID=1227549 RepID=A0A1H6R505_9RHOB|nr:alpha/beta fold hydrolase [Cribrihabitans marinus]GGH20087.1 fluoroacetate dehalogenase [Cribrihabitans marinus]SEI48304.1 haloacetate dehalogenase [Cribrihabitans marinus]